LSRPVLHQVTTSGANITQAIHKAEVAREANGNHSLPTQGAVAMEMLSKARITAQGGSVGTACCPASP